MVLTLDAGVEFRGDYNVLEDHRAREAQLSSVILKRQGKCWLSSFFPLFFPKMRVLLNSYKELGHRWNPLQSVSRKLGHSTCWKRQKGKNMRVTFSTVSPPLAVGSWATMGGMTLSFPTSLPLEAGLWTTGEGSHWFPGLSFLTAPSHHHIPALGCNQYGFPKAQVNDRVCSFHTGSDFLSSLPLSFSTLSASCSCCLVLYTLIS